MSHAMVGALLGLAFAGGVLLAVLFSPPVRRLRLGDRLQPYLADAPRPSSLLAGSARSALPLGAVGRLVEPVLEDAAGLVERLLGGSRSVRRRLVALGSPHTVEDFRVEQVIWGVGGVVAGTGGSPRRSAGGSS